MNLLYSVHIMSRAWMKSIQSQRHNKRILCPILPTNHILILAEKCQLALVWLIELFHKCVSRAAVFQLLIENILFVSFSGLPLCQQMGKSYNVSVALH